MKPDTQAADFRNSLAKARDEWMESRDGKQAIEPSILREERLVKYLRNRIGGAFIAGWNARENQQ